MEYESCDDQKQGYQTAVVYVGKAYIKVDIRIVYGWYTVILSVLTTTLHNFHL